MDLVPRATFWMGPDSGPLVFRFEDYRHRHPNIWVVGSYSKRVLEEKLTSYPTVRFERLEIPLRRPFHLAAREEVKILGGMPSNSRIHGSEAIYWLEWYIDDQSEVKYAVKAYSLLPGCKTSPHHHLKHWERFNRVAGGLAKLKLGKPLFEHGERIQRLRGSASAAAGTAHQLIAQEAPVLIFVEMRGPDPLGMGDHHYAS